MDGPARGRQCELAGRIVIGRSDVALRIDDPSVSRTHAIVDATDPESVTVADAGSSRGTTLDGVAVTDPVPLPAGGRLRLGHSDVMRIRSVRFPPADDLRIEARAPDGTLLRAPLRGTVRVGRDPSSELALDDSAVSRAHFVIRESPEGSIIEDTGSRAGVRVNGRSVTGSRVIVAGDEIEIPGSGWVLRVVKSARAAVAPGLIRVRREGQGAVTAARVLSSPSSTVADVATALAEFTGWREPGPLTLYRESDGIVLHPDDRWRDVRLSPGDVVAVADVQVRSAEEWRGDWSATVVRPGQSLVDDPAPVALDAPRAPEATSLRGRGIVWQLAGGVAGVLGGLVIAVALQNWLFAVVGAVTGLGAVAAGILGDRSRRKHRAAEFKTRLAQVDERAREAVSAQERALRARGPAPGERLIALQSGTGVWSRAASDPDALRVRLGVGERRARVRVVVPGGDVAPEFQPDLHGIAQDRSLHEVPVLGPRGGALGLVGPPRVVDDAGRAVVLDAAFHHAPSALAIHLVARADEWDALAWLPHLATADGVRIYRGDRAGSDAARAAAADLAGGLTCMVVGPAGLLGGEELLSRDDPGLLVVFGAGAPHGLPRGVRRWVEYESTAAARAVGEFADGPLASFAPDLVGPDAAEEEALAGARLSDPHLAPIGVVRSRALLELNDVRRGETVEVADSWAAASGRGLSAVIGTDASNSPVRIDLTQDGPHAVIAGTTGSGKSELLASLLGSLVARHRPEDLALFLIDFKGGATFGRFSAAPHVVGVVTDLEQDAGLTERAFAALDVELARRKRLLAAAQASDLDAYRAAGADPPMGRLLVVIDEFALLVQSNPDVRARLDAVAAQGRSLGVHLVLATQSPGGVLSPAIRANTNLWISLRVVSDAESREVLGTADAARLPVREPGRGLMRRGAEGRLTPFQTARVTVTRDVGEEHRVIVRPLLAEPVHTDVASSDASKPSATGRQDLDLLIDAVRAEAHRGSYRAPPVLWLDPLGRVVTADTLDEDDESLPGDFPVRIGLADLVARQRHETQAFDLAVTGILITGAPRTGRSTALIQIATDLAIRHPPARLHMYGIHAGGPLAQLEGLPHVAGIVQADDLERVGRVLDTLTDLIAARRSRPRDQDDARVLLLVDDYPSVREVLETRLPARAVDQLLSIIIGGRPVGVHVALATSQPADIRIAAAAGVGHRLMLAAVDRADYQAIDVRSAIGAATTPTPGRGLIVGGVEVQVALPDVPRSLRLAAAWPSEGRPRTVVALPTSVRLSDLAATGDGGDVIGLSARELAPVALPTDAGAHLVVLGESGSGRSTVLLTIALAHLAHPGARAVVFAPRGGPLMSLRAQPGVALFASDAVAAAEVIDAVGQPSGATLLLIDDAERWPASSGDSLEKALRRGPELGLRAAIAARGGDWVRTFDSWVRYVASLKSGLLLNSAPEIASAFDVRLEQVVAPPAPGRGFLVRRGRAEFLQVADPGQAAR